MGQAMTVPLDRGPISALDATFWFTCRLLDVQCEQEYQTTAATRLLLLM